MAGCPHDHPQHHPGWAASPGGACFSAFNQILQDWCPPSCRTLGIPWQLSSPFILSLDEAMAQSPAWGEDWDADLQAAGLQLEQEVIGLASSQEEQPIALAGEELQVQPHCARGVRQRHLHEAVPKERGWGEKGERSGRKGTSCQPCLGGCCDYGSSQAHPSASPLVAI